MNNRINALFAVVFWLVFVAAPGGGVGYPQGSEDPFVNDQFAAPMMWREPTDIEQRDLFYGIGGRENQPDPSIVYKLIGRNTEGTQPKMIVEDDRGGKWILKTGPEARPETTTTRIVWAAGYHVDQDYFVQSVHILGETNFVEDNVRFERFEPTETDLGRWSWKRSPFFGDA